MHDGLLDDVQDCIDAMSQAVRECDSKAWTYDELWSELDAQCQVLARLSEASSDEEQEDDEDVEEDEDGVDEINFDDDNLLADGADVDVDEDMH